MVPNVRSGRRTLSPASLSIWKACGLGTSWVTGTPMWGRAVLASDDPDERFQIRLGAGLDHIRRGPAADDRLAVDLDGDHHLSQGVLARGDRPEAIVLQPRGG